MHKPSQAFLHLIAEAGGVPAASKAYKIPRSTLYCVHNGNRQMGRELAVLLHKRSNYRYSAADLLGLPDAAQDAKPWT